ncbi:unnamed protein product [Linum trigynum]|uniref:Uncharacterized protein n=1 Tax=Linum trigynum TaxID=586398 RepID=A0AAV2G1R2_9ROSI
MAATRALLELSIFLLITAAATTAQTTDPITTKCFEGNGGDQLELSQAVQIKKSLIQDTDRQLWTNRRRLRLRSLRGVFF